MKLKGFPLKGGGAQTRAAKANTAEVHELATEGEGFASIGLPPEAGWYVSAALYWIGGLAVVLIDQLASPGTIDPLIGVLGAIALAAAPLMLLGARFAPTASWGMPVRILIPSVIFALGSFVIGNAINALALLFFFPILAVAYMHRPAIALPYCFASLLVMDAVLLAYDSSSEGVARAIVLFGFGSALVIGLVIAQSRLRSAAAANHNRSVTDPLTGLTNLRGLRTRLQQELQRTTRDDTEVVMYAIDLDDFKEVNDRFSYALGDAVLQAVAQALAEEVEPGDLVARRGGDEFAVLAIASPGRHMARFGDRLTAAIERTRRAVCPGVNPRASVKRVNHEPGESAEAFLRRVDDGLHAAKLDAHPERALLDQPELSTDSIDGEAQAERMLDGARRVQASLGNSKRQSMGGEEGEPLAWKLASGAALVSAALICAVTVPDLLPGTRNAVTVLSVVGLLVVAAACWAASHARSAHVWIHVPVAVMMLLTIACVAAAGGDSYAMAELCILPVPLAVVVLGVRQATPYAVLAGASYAYFVLESGEPYAPLQTILLLGVLVVLTALLARGDRLAGEFSAAAEAISIVDPLTGTANLRGFTQRVDQEISRASSTGDEVCLLMIDLDRFKLVNDRYSHSMGDALLIETARAIESVVREDELVVRRGGDEFVVVCAPRLPGDIDSLASRISDAVIAARVRLTPDIVAGATVTGVLHKEGESTGDFSRRADEVLRLAKLSRRTQHARR
ncbi:MAG: GGDEF domain-containing protein [Solirubrobacterales bacterium]